MSGPAMVPLMRNRQGRPYAPQHYGHRRPVRDAQKGIRQAWDALKVRVEQAVPWMRRAAEYVHRALGGES